MSKFLNKRKMVLILTVIFVFFIGAIIFTYFYSSNNKINLSKNFNDINKQEEQIQKEITSHEEQNKETIIVEENIEGSSDSSVNKDTEKKQENSNASDINKTDPKNEYVQEESNNSTKEKNNSQSEELKKDTESDNNEKEIIQEEPQTKNAWDELGISEYDYYNTPMWNWARIDFSINDYKTYDKTREACINKGEEYYEQGYGYSCTSINSYSGNYLGEMLKTF